MSLREGWTKYQLQYLTENYKYKTSKEIGDAIGKSSTNVRKKAYELNIHRKDFKWSEYQIDLLISLYREIPTYDLSKKLKRSVLSIHSFIRDRKDFLIKKGFIDNGFYRVCQICKKDFYTYHGSQISCSKKCSDENHRLYKLQWAKDHYKPLKYTRFVYCMNCLTQFEPNSPLRKYCSKKCKDLHSTASKKARDKFNGKTKKGSDVDFLLKLYGDIE
ncbi:MAG: hypothetical protein RBR54_06405 [Sulfurimonas sp.]|jgi:hypothetical protein|nr:hypothetical protein [Sulfurimonas sp.]